MLGRQLKPVLLRMFDSSFHDFLKKNFPTLATVCISQCGLFFHLSVHVMVVVVEI